MATTGKALQLELREGSNPDFYDLGIDIDGHFFTLAKPHKPNLDGDIAAAKERAEAEQSQSKG